MTVINDELQNMILKYLKPRQENAISKNNLLSLCGLSVSKTDDRVLRIAIKELRRQGTPIGLSLKRPSGYYLIETAEELEQCMNTLLGYCVEAARTRRDLKVALPRLYHDVLRKKYAEKHPGQLTLI